MIEKRPLTGALLYLFTLTAASEATAVTTTAKSPKTKSLTVPVWCRYAITGDATAVTMYIACLTFAGIVKFIINLSYIIVLLLVEICLG